MATVKIGNRVEAFLADKANTTYELAKGRLIATDDYGIDVTGAATGRVLKIGGWIDADTAAIRLGTGQAEAAPVRVEIGESGRVSSGITGIETHGAGHVIRNAGEVTGGTDGMVLYGMQTVVNTGEISGGTNGMDIHGGGEGFTLVRNAGTISGETRSLYGSNGIEKVINTGSLVGDVELLGGEDVFTFKAGTIEGVVRGGEGSDIYIVKKEGLNIVENIGQGNDGVRSTISFTLQANVEELNLLGKKNIDGMGNGSDNEIYGNAGRNSLNGGAGFDLLEGNKGNDILTGGIGADEFRFHRGDGKDTVMDYEAGFDELQFDSLKGASDFADMVANHIQQKGEDLWITYGDDVIILKGTTENELQANDFMFTD